MASNYVILRNSQIMTSVNAACKTTALQHFVYKTNKL